jgi:hypothetical protein
MSLSLTRKTYYWTAAGVVVAVIAILVTVMLADGSRAGSSPAQEQQPDSNGCGVQVRGDGNQVQVTAEQFKCEVKELTREQAQLKARAYASVAPPAHQPAPFVVIDAPKHLWVRSSGTTTGHHIGAAYDGSTVWADCQITTDFDPDPSDDAGAVWLRIHWPTEKPNDKLASSQPSDRFAGWVYAGQTVPAGHNGKIPICVNP